MTREAQPTRQTFPICRATTAAWAVRPPIAVNMPADAANPAKSSVDVSRLTSMAGSRRVMSWRAHAPAGDAGRRWNGFGHSRRGFDKTGRSRRVRIDASDALDRLLAIDQPLFDPIDGDFQRRARRALGGASLQEER